MFIIMNFFGFFTNFIKLESIIQSELLFGFSIQKSGVVLS